MRTLKEVVEYYESKNERSLKRWEMNLILDKYNYDKDRLFRETVKERDGIMAGVFTEENEMDEKDFIDFLKEIVPDKPAEEGKIRPHTKNQREVFIEISNATADMEMQIKKEIYDLFMTFELLDIEISCFRQSALHKDINNARITLMFTAVTREDLEVDTNLLSEEMDEYLQRFYNDYQIGFSDGHIEIYINKQKK